MKKYLVAIAVAFTVNMSAFAYVPELVNGSFENNNLDVKNSGPFGFLYGQVLPWEPWSLLPSVYAPGWTFSNNSGLSFNNTNWGGVAEDGNVFAFLQSSPYVPNAVTPSISQSFTSIDLGSLSFSFALEQRTNFQNGGPQTIAVTLDGLTIWSGTPTDNWITYTTSLRKV